MDSIFFIIYNLHILNFKLKGFRSNLIAFLRSIGYRPIIVSNKTRAKSLNKGAYLANAKYLLFLHIDSELDHSTVINLIQTLKKNDREALYYFSLKFEDGRILRLNSLGANLRSRLFSLPYGDQGFCLSKELFLRIGGFPENVKYGEDLYFVLKTKRLGIPIINIPNYLITSSRKYLNNGWFITTLLHQWRLILILINFYFKKKLKSNHDF